MYYKEVKETYDKLLLAGDSLYASYYNNLSLLYQEMGQFEEAADCLKKALAIMELYQDKIKIAITCSNLAASLLASVLLIENVGIRVDFKYTDKSIVF